MPDDNTTHESGKEALPDEEEDTRLDRGLLRPSRRVHVRDEQAVEHSGDWMRAYWLGLGLFLVLFAFWLLDTLKDPIFGQLVAGNLDRHLPPAKLLSVCTTLLLVCSLEYISNEENQQRKQDKEKLRTHDDILDGGGTWSRMDMATVPASAYGHGYNDWTLRIDNDDETPDDRVSSRVFLYVCLPYCVFFGVMASLLQFNPLVALADPSTASEQMLLFDPELLSVSNGGGGGTTYWHFVGYGLFAGIESFGSLAVATFWSYTNSTLALQDAKRFYGVIIALAQLGAILGASMVTTHIWSSITLIVLACLIIILHVIVMRLYSRRYPPTADTIGSSSGGSKKKPEEPGVSEQNDTLWSGVYLILRHNYVLLVLGTSCLYEISLTCLNYQMTLLGWSRFEESDHKMSFKQFMGHYGQMVNISSLLLSSIVFPWLIRRFGLRITIRVFPSLLMLANIVAFGAIQKNLAFLFFSISTLKAMTYSIHDPAKELLYIPTSNAIKFKSKFWIDVVGARIAKAIGSSINRYAGSVDRSIRVASAPSLLTAAALWWVCYRVGEQFDALVESHAVVGVENDNNFRKVGSDHDLFEDVLVPLSTDEPKDSPDPGIVELSQL